MGKQTLGLSLLCSLGLLMVACGDSGSSGSRSGTCPTGQVECDGMCIPEITPTLDGVNGIQAAVFDGACAGCHSSTAPQASLDLSSAAVSAQQLINVDSEQVDGLRVAPGDSGSSYLVNKLLGVGIAPTTQIMPLSGMLCDAKIDAVAQWIDGGAPVQ